MLLSRLLRRTSASTTATVTSTAVRSALPRGSPLLRTHRTLTTLTTAAATRSALASPSPKKLQSSSLLPASLSLTSAPGSVWSSPRRSMVTAGSEDLSLRAKRLCVAIDGSDHSKKALGVAKSLLTKTGDHLYLLSIPPPVELDPGLGVEFRVAVEKKRNENVSLMMADCERRCATLSREQYTIVVGDPAGGPRDALLKFVDEKQIDILVLGSRGLGGFRKLLLGSVSSYAVAHANCHVLVVK